MSACEGIYFQTVEPSEQRNLTCVVTRSALKELEGHQLALPDLLRAFSNHKSSLEQLASDIFDKSRRPRLPAVTVGLREVRADRYSKSDAYQSAAARKRAFLSLARRLNPTYGYRVFCAMKSE
jgi:uncharacterized protein DUF1488